MVDQAERNELTPVTVLFVDISASTTLYAERGDAAAFALIKKCLDLLGAEVSAAGGRVIRQVGDGVLATFTTAVSGLRAAIQISQTMADPSRTLAREGIRVRSGLSTGSVVLAGGDVYGDVVNVAARLVGRADAGEIFLSGSVCDALPPDVRDAVQLIDEMALRNHPAPVRVYRYVPDLALATIRAAAPSKRSAPTMELVYQDLHLVLGDKREWVSIGRHADNDFCVDHQLVSRRHATVALTGERFTLVDHSTNGTYVYVDNGSMLRLVREELVLTGSGRIVLGADDAPQPIRYRITPE